MAKIMKTISNGMTNKEMTILLMEAIKVLVTLQLALIILDIINLDMNYSIKSLIKSY